jgi:hypothetical protein
MSGVTIRQPQHGVDRFGKPDIGVIEHRRAIEHDLEDQHR